jgi:hypothetical protein
MADQGHRGTRVRSPNSSGPAPHRPHPERDNASDPRRPYTDPMAPMRDEARREDSQKR